jgi:hypothetical protein
MKIKIKCEPGKNYIELTYEQIEKIYYDLQEIERTAHFGKDKDPVEELKKIFGMKD